MIIEVDSVVGIYAHTDKGFLLSWNFTERETDQEQFGSIGVVGRSW